MSQSTSNLFLDGSKFRRLRPDSDSLTYSLICDDFGPMNMSAIVEFIALLEQEMEAYPNSRIVYCVDDGSRNLTNGVFLLGSYMLISLDLTAYDKSHIQRRARTHVSQYSSSS
jgi:hypothetical protein